jgi:hypothetical protein
MEDRIVLLVAGGARAPAGVSVRMVESPGLPGAEIAKIEADWIVVRLPGEDAEGNDASLNALIEQLPQVPGEAEAVEVPCVQVSPSGDRVMSLVRAWRPRAARGLGPWPDVGVLVPGRKVRALKVQLQVERWRWSDAVGRAERLERAGEWLAARDHWSAHADGDVGAAGSFARMRSALCLGVLQPLSPAVRDDLGRAWTAHPTVVEAGLRLAAWWLAAGDVPNACTVADMAMSVSSVHPAIPQLEGAGNWLVPAQMAEWLASRAPGRARAYAERALSHAPPPVQTARMMEIVSAVPDIGNPKVELLQPPIPSQQE